MYADVELLLIGWVPTVLTPAPRAGVATPADPAGTNSWVPFVKFQRVGGPRQLGIDTARVVWECFDSTYGGASSLANRLSVALETKLPGYTGAGGFVSRVDVTGPSWLPYDNVNLTRFSGQATVVVHSL